MAIDTYQREYITGRDCRGHTGKVSVYSASDSSVDDSAKVANGLVEAFFKTLYDDYPDQDPAKVGNKVSNCAFCGTSLAVPFSIDPGVYGKSGAGQEYINAENKLRLVFSMGDGSLGRIEVPAPGKENFLADQETLDPANANVIALAGSLQATGASGEFLCDKRGQQFGNLVGGRLIRRRLQRKLTAYSKNPQLTTGEA